MSDTHPTPAMIRSALATIGIQISFDQWNEAMELAKIEKAATDAKCNIKLAEALRAQADRLDPPRKMGRAA